MKWTCCGLSILAAALLGSACGSGGPGVGFDQDAGDRDASGPTGPEGGLDISLGGQTDGVSPMGCVGLKCQVHACGGGNSTT